MAVLNGVYVPTKLPLASRPVAVQDTKIPSALGGALIETKIVLSAEKAYGACVRLACLPIAPPLELRIAPCPIPGRPFENIRVGVVARLDRVSQGPITRVECRLPSPDPLNQAGVRFRGRKCPSEHDAT